MSTSPEDHDDQGYYARRAETERFRAAEAKDERVRKVHESLAAEYEVRAAQGMAND